MTPPPRFAASRAIASLTLAGIALAACGDGVDDNTAATTVPTTAAPDTVPAIEAATTPPETIARDDPFGWTRITGGIYEGRLVVPLDYEDPNGPTITLFLVKNTVNDASKRIGSLLVNPGGPGFGGSDLASAAEYIYGRDLLDRFDIIGWDPRGTGYSEPAVDCIDDYDHFFGVDSSPDTAQERDQLVELGRQFAAGCEERSGDLLAHISTADSARDMNTIREALGEEQISYFGFSYGSELGATWATMFPDTVRAAVLDGAVDPAVAYLAQNLQQAAGFEATFTTFLAQCSANPACAFHNGGDAEGAFDRLSAAIDAASVQVSADRTVVTQGVLFTAVAAAMYDQSDWRELEHALADLQGGEGQGILDLYDDYYGYFGDGWGDGLEAYFAIGCLDDPGSTGPDDLYSHEAEFAAVAPRLGRGWLAELTFCAVWPYPPAAPVTITGAGAGPVLVVGTTGDAATPLASTRAMAAALEDGHLVVVGADQHTGYGVNDCVDTVVDDYLVDPTTPLAAEIDCR
jgi:pimeloyl-ACP methyl ester carboxylesterase